MSDTPTTPRASALVLACGAFLCIVAPALLGASWYSHVTTVPAGPESTGGNSVALAWIGWVLLLVGAMLLALGTYRLAAHADRAAGVLVAAPNAVAAPSD